jgi:hypothetical protein
LGAIFTTPYSYSNTDIQFTNVKTGQTGANVALGYETYSTHHPVSFKYNSNVIGMLTAPPYSRKYKYNPPALGVKLDRYERMQCTTCHDPHQDKSTVPDPSNTPFWSTTDYATACLSCHDLASPPTNPWKP